MKTIWVKEMVTITLMTMNRRTPLKGGLSPLSEMIDDMMVREPREHKRYKARFRSEARNGFPSLNISRFS